MKAGSFRKNSASVRTMPSSGSLNHDTAPPATFSSPCSIEVMSWVGPLAPGWTMGARDRSRGRNTGTPAVAKVR